MPGVNFRIGRSLNGPRTGIDWNGNPSGRRAIRFNSPPAIVPMTYIWKVYQRQQITRSPNHRYYTTFFYGYEGTFTGSSNYYGNHPYPSPTAPTSDGKWEISTQGMDYIGLGTNNDDAASSPHVVEGWYSQAAVYKNVSSTGEAKFWFNLPSTDTSNFIERTGLGTFSAAASPIIIWGQAPDNGSNQSWGGYTQWEEQNAIIRGVQIYTSALTEAQIIALAAKEYDSEVLAYCTANSITSLWYLNMNWTVADISDKSGNGHNPSWVNTNSEVAADWSE